MKHLKFVAALFMTLIGLAASSRAQDPPAQYMQAGNTAYAGKNYDQAIINYQSVLQTNPNYWQAYQGLGNCYYAKGQFNDALTSYQKALAINPNNPALASFAQSLQAKIGIPAPPLPGTLPNTLPAASQPAAYQPDTSNLNRVSSPGAGKVEVDIFGGVDLILNDTNPIPATVITSSTGLTIPWAGGNGVGGGGGLAVYFPLSRNFSIGFSSTFNGYGASYNYTVPAVNYGYYGSTNNLGVTETVSQSSIEELVAVKYRFEANGARPYLLAGVGSAQVFTDMTLSVDTSGSGTISNYAYIFPPYLDFCPMVQAGFGVEFPMGNDANFFLEGKLGLIFVGATPQSGLIDIQGTLYTYNFNSPGYTLMELPVDIGLNFNL